MTDAARAAFVRWCQWGYEHRASIHYQQFRPIPVHLPPGRLPIWQDCSGSITLFAKWAGVPDPNGLGYNGQGFTGTLLQYLPHISRAEALPGDLGVYGAYPGHHVVALFEAGSNSDPMVFSHGSEIGPLKLRLSAESSAHRSDPVTWLRLMPPKEEFMSALSEAAQHQLASDAAHAAAYAAGAVDYFAGNPQPPNESPHLTERAGWSSARDSHENHKFLVSLATAYGIDRTAADWIDQVAKKVAGT